MQKIIPLIKVTQLIILGLFIFYSPLVYATIYSPGETLTPDCGPTDSNCGVITSVYTSDSLTDGALLFSSSNAWSLLSAGTNGQVLKLSGGLPVWGSVTMDALTSAIGTGSIDNTNYSQTWNWSTSTTENPLSITSNALTTGSLLSLTTSNNSLNSTNGFLYVANTGASTSGTLARFASNSTAGSGLTILTNGNVGVGVTSPSQELDLIGDLELENTTSNDTGVVYKGANRFIHNFQHPTGGGAVPIGDNLFMGDNAGNFTMGSTATEYFHSSYNTGIGANSIYSNTTGHNNVGVGTDSLYSNTSGSGNSAVGTNSLRYNNTGNNNSAIGESALYLNTTGYSNSAIGSSALNKNTTGYYNSAIGMNSLYSNTAGYSNLATGYSALRSNTEGNYNSAVGANALYDNTTGNNNSAIGAYSLNFNTTGYDNTVVGMSSLRTNTTGYKNIAVGLNAGRYITDTVTDNATSNTSVYLGVDTKSLASGDSNEIVIGYDATGVGSNSVVLGNDSITKTILKGDVGINTTTPGQKLEVYGTIRTRLDADEYVDFGSVGNPTGGFTSFFINPEGNPNGTNIAYYDGDSTWDFGSDQRIKRDIESMDSVLEKINALKIRKFNYKNSPDRQYKDIGVVAQELEPYFPELVSEYISKDDGLPLKTVGYSTFGVLAIKAIQELQVIIDDIKSKIALMQESGKGSATALEVGGHITLEKDSVGEAIIPAGENSVTITFSESYTDKPIITVTPQGVHLGIDYGVENINSNSFDISIEPTSSDDIIFNWHAFARKGDVFTVEVKQENISENNIVEKVENKEEENTVSEGEDIENSEDTPADNSEGEKLNDTELLPESELETKSESETETVAGQTIETENQESKSEQETKDTVTDNL